MADDVVFNITGDSAGAVTAMQEVLQAVQDLDTIFSTIQTSIDDVSTSLTALGANTADLSTIATSATDMDTAFSALLTTLNDAATALQALVQPLTDSASGMTDLSTAVPDVATALGDIATSAGDAATAFDELVPAVGDTATSMVDLSTTAPEVAVAMDDIATSTAAAAAALDAYAASAGSAASSNAGLASATAASTGAATAGASAAGAAGAAEESAAASTKSHTTAGEQNGMMLMMLVPLLLQGASGFISQGSAANDAISKIKGFSDQSLLASENQGRLDMVIKNLQEDSIKYGVTMTAAGQGLYTLISTGYSTDDAMKLLSASMETAGASGARMQDVSKALGTTMSAYNLTADQAYSVTNKMTTAVVDGNQNFQDFANSIGKTAAAGHTAGISLNEVLAAESTLTHSNPSVRLDMTHLDSLFIELSTHADKTAAAAKKLGIAFDLNKYQAMNLQEKLEYVQKAAKGNLSTFQSLMANQTNAATAQAILANGGKTYAGILDDVTNKTDSLAKASANAQQDLSYVWNQINGAISVVAQQLVSMLGPIIGPILHQFASGLGAIAMNAKILEPIFIGLAVAMSVLILGAMEALVGMMAAAASPFVVLGIAIGALITTIMMLIPKFQAASQAATPLGREIRSLQTQFQSAANYIKTEWDAVIKAMGPVLTEIGTIVKQNVIPALEAFAGGVMQAIIGMMNTFGNVLKGVAPLLQDFANWLKNKVEPALRAVQPQINAFMALLGRMSPMLLILLPGLAGIALNFGKIGEIVGVASKALGGIGNAFKSIEVALNGVIPFLKNIGPFFKSMGGMVKIAAQAVWDFTGVIGPAFRAALTGAGNALNGIRTIFGASLGPLDLVKNLWIALGDALAPVGEALAGVASTAAGVAVIIAALVAAMVAFFTQTSFGRALIKMLWEEMLKLGGVIVSALQPAWVALQQAMKDLAPLWGQVVEALKPLYPAFVLIGGIIGTVVVIALGLLIGVIAGVITALGQFLAGCIRVVSGVIQVFTGLVQFFSGLLTIIVGIFTLNGDTIQKGWNSMGAGLVNITKGFWQAIQGVCQAFIGTIVGLISGFAKTTIGFFQHIADVVVHHSIVPNMWKAVHQSTQSGTQKVQTTVQQHSTNVQSTFTTLAQKTVATTTAHQKTLLQNQAASNTALLANHTQTHNKMVATTQSSMNNQVAAVKTAHTAIHNTVTTKLAATVSTHTAAHTKMTTTTKTSTATQKTAVDKTYSALPTTVKTATDKAASSTQAGFQKMTDTTKSSMQDMSQAVNAGLVSIQNSFVKTWDYIVKIFGMSWTNMLNVVKTYGQAMTLANDDTWKNIRKSTENGIDDVVGTAGTLEDKLKAVFAKLDSDAITWGADLIKNFIAGMQSQNQNLSAAATSAAETVKKPLGFSLPSEGPLANADTYMPDMMQLLAKGITDNVGLVKNAATQAASAVQGAAPTGINVGTSSQSGVTKEHISVLKDILTAIKDQGKQQQSSSSSSTQIGYPIPSTTLGSITQQFGGSGGNASNNAVSGLYTQINQLAGLSNEYAKRGASTGVGF